MKNKKHLGQNWLKNRAILDEIAVLARLEPFLEGNGSNRDFTCLEIGPGLGTLTSSLFRHFEKILAVEYDENLAKNLPKSFPGKNLRVENADFLEFDLGRIKEPYVVAGNIPYYITSPIIKKLLTSENLPQKIVLLVQKEVAERVCAKKQTFLSIFANNYARCELGPVVGREHFTPVPKVDSQVLIMTPHQPILDKKELKLVSIGFVSPRKKLSHNLASGALVLDGKAVTKETIKEILAKLNLNPDCRASDLTIADWKSLAQSLKI